MKILANSRRSGAGQSEGGRAKEPFFLSAYVVYLEMAQAAQVYLLLALIITKHTLCAGLFPRCHITSTKKHNDICTIS